MNKRVGASEVLAAANISYRQLDYWTSNGWVRCKRDRPGTGNRRSFTCTEVRVLCAMSELVRSGVEPSIAARVARQIVRSGSGRLSKGLRVVAA